MKTRYLTVTLTMVAHIVAAESFVRSEFDHLVPMDLNKNAKYRKILMSKFNLTPFNCGRSIVLPAFEPEGTLSVYYVSRNGRRTYHVTDISAEDNLWQRTDGGRYPEKAKNVKTTRCDAEIDERTAQLVREVWLGLLEGPHGPRSITPPKWEIVLDSMIAELWLERPNLPPLYAELDFSLSFPGRKTKQLADIVNALHEYCKAEPKDRPAIAAKIDRNAKQLLAELKRAR